MIDIRIKSNISEDFALSAFDLNLWLRNFSVGIHVTLFKPMENPYLQATFWFKLSMIKPKEKNLLSNTGYQEIFTFHNLYIWPRN